MSRGKQMDRLLLPPHVTFLIGGATSSAVLVRGVPKTSVEGKYALYMVSVKTQTLYIVLFPAPLVLLP